ncbi:DUF2059 domain-containing protein [Sphingomonas sp. AOB5]|uniref:DUF2059 domain-containing protein n=1 Tax=Sphingomonas sp. AOB5 TaxID=3034017 RepID=UPI0023F7604E|nr:DUF2059 domain-containing protein [Sphingomonas sp. AOB5]MDF7777627.1 DUF2059 domain-containing protein [Sphingomonas sp. AOB5]
MSWLAALLLLTGATDPEAEALGKRLAEASSLAALLPAVAAKEREEMLAEHPEWTDADKAAFRETADAVAARGMDRLTTAMGKAYATRLSLDDLRALVAFNETPAAKRMRAVAPAVMIETAGALDGMDYKGETRRAFCTRTGKLCEAAN